MTNNILKQIEYWEKSAERDWETSNFLFATKRYDACLFFCHLTLEKILKGLAIKKVNQPAPYIHDLAKLSKLAQLDLSKEQIQNLRILSSFNIAARYDDFKFAFYKKCTESFSKKYLSITKNLYQCLKKEYLKK